MSNPADKVDVYVKLRAVLRLADEYEQAKMPRMAKYIRGDAEVI